MHFEEIATLAKLKMLFYYLLDLRFSFLEEIFGEWGLIWLFIVTLEPKLWEMDLGTEF